MVFVLRAAEKKREKKLIKLLFPIFLLLIRLWFADYFFWLIAPLFALNRTAKGELGSFETSPFHGDYSTEKFPCETIHFYQLNSARRMLFRLGTEMKSFILGYRQVKSCNHKETFSAFSLHFTFVSERAFCVIEVSHFFVSCTMFIAMLMDISYQTFMWCGEDCRLLICKLKRLLLI